MREADKGEVTTIDYDDLIPEILTDLYFEEDKELLRDDRSLRQNVESRFSGSPEERLEIFNYFDLRRRRLLGLMRDYRERLVGLERGVLNVEMFLNIEAGEELEESDPLRRALEGAEPMFMYLIEQKLEEVPWRMMKKEVYGIARKAGVEDIGSVEFKLPRW